MTTKRTTKTPGATETTPAAEQDVLGEEFAEAPTQDAGTSDVGSTETTAQTEPTPAELMQQIELLKQQLAAQQEQPKQAKAVAPHVPTSEASASNTGRWVLTDKGWAVKEIV